MNNEKQNPLEFDIDIGGYYGAVTFVKRGNEYAIEFMNDDGLQTLSISEEFFKAAQKELLK